MLSIVKNIKSKGVKKAGTIKAIVLCLLSFGILHNSSALKLQVRTSGITKNPGNATPVPVFPATPIVVSDADYSQFFTNWATKFSNQSIKNIIHLLQT